jgi:hypothetical protein
MIVPVSIVSRLPAAFLAASLVAGFTLSTPLAAADRGFYVGAKIGTTDVEQSFGDTVEQLIDGEEDSVAFEVGFRFSKYLGVQAGYHDLGDFPGIACDGGCVAPDEVAEVESSTKAYSLSAVPELSLPLGFSIFGKAGVVFWESEVKAIGDVGTAFLDDFSDEDVILGGGARFALPGPFSVFAEWEQIAGDFETISLGATLSF